MNSACKVLMKPIGLVRMLRTLNETGTYTTRGFIFQRQKSRKMFAFSLRRNWNSAISTRANVNLKCKYKSGIVWLHVFVTFIFFKNTIMMPFKLGWQQGGAHENVMTWKRFCITSWSLPMCKETLWWPMDSAHKVLAMRGVDFCVVSWTSRWTNTRGPVICGAIPLKCRFCRSFDSHIALISHAAS